jgi:hypothetical protein
MTTGDASISLHSLARWHQRVLNVSDAALRMDLLAIARAKADILASPHWGEFVIPAGGGRWVGHLARFEREGVPTPLLCVRIFLHASQPVKPRLAHKFRRHCRTTR